MTIHCKISPLQFQNTHGRWIRYPGLVDYYMSSQTTGQSKKHIYSSYLMHFCLLYIDKIVISLIISFTLHANITFYLHSYISQYVSKFSFIIVFPPPPFFSTSQLNVLWYCSAAQRRRIKKNSSNTLSHLSRSFRSTSRHM